MPPAVLFWGYAGAFHAMLVVAVVVAVAWLNAELRATDDERSPTTEDDDDDVAKLSTISDRQSRLDTRRRRLHDVTVTSFTPPCDVIVTSFPTRPTCDVIAVVASSLSSAASHPPTN